MVMQEPTPALSAAPTVVVISDNGLFREGLAQFLDRSARCHVAGVSHAAGSVVLVAELQPDVVVLDVACDASLTAARLIAEATPHVRVVAVSASTDLDSAVAFGEAGVVGWL